MGTPFRGVEMAPTVQGQASSCADPAEQSLLQHVWDGKTLFSADQAQQVLGEKLGLSLTSDVIGEN